MLWAMWAHEYMAIFFFKLISVFLMTWRYVILIKFCQYITEMMAVAVENLKNF